MTFVYDRDRYVAVDTESNYVLQGGYSDEPGVLRHRLTRGDWVVEFDVLIITEKRSFKWRGTDQFRSVLVRSCIVEPSLRRSFYRAMRRQTGSAPDEETYRKFRAMIEQGVFVLDTHGGRDLQFAPDFHVKFVDGYDELNKKPH